MFHYSGVECTCRRQNHCPQQKKAMVEKHVGLIRQAAKQGAQIVCLQEIFNGPYFCAEQETKWYEMTEPVPDGPTVS